MTIKSKSNSASVTMLSIIMIAFITTFISCKKTDLKGSTPPIESLAANDNAIIVIPGGLGLAGRQSDAPEKYNTFY